MEKKVLNINGIPRTIIANSEASLADVLRGQLGLTGTKVGCGRPSAAPARSSWTGKWSVPASPR